MDISFLGPAGASVVIVFLFLKFMKEEADRREASYKNLSQAIKKNTEVSKETKEFLVNLNGSLKRVVKKKQKEAK